MIVVSFTISDLQASVNSDPISMFLSPILVIFGLAGIHAALAMATPFEERSPSDDAKAPAPGVAAVSPPKVDAAAIPRFPFIPPPPPSVHEGLDIVL